MKIDIPKTILSASELRTHSECARKRYYSSRGFLALRAAKPNGNLVLGTAVHNMLAYYYTSIEKMLEEWGLADAGQVAKADIQKAYNELPPFDRDLVNFVSDDDERIFEVIEANYMEQLLEDLETFRVLEVERRFEMNNWPKEGVTYHGYIDMVVQSRVDGKIYYFEHKTGKNFRPEIYNRFDIQLHLYDLIGKDQHENWGGIILNELKKAKTARGYGNLRNTYAYSEQERAGFIDWMIHETEKAENSRFEPSNDFMKCRMCEYAPICMKYGYEAPKTAEEIYESEFFVDPDTGERMYEQSLREDQEDNE